MTHEMFLAQFGHIAASPNGVQKLRELILILAVHGKLIPQDSNDEPASKLLKRIAAEKAGAIKKSKPIANVDESDAPHSIPDGWVWIRFGDIALHNAGKTLDRGRNSGKCRPYITTSNLYWGRFDLREVRQMPIRDEELEKCTARKGDLLICEGGEAGRAAVWDNDYEICFQNHIHRARFYYGVDAFYAFRFFEKLNATGEINEYRKGVGISNMSGKALASIAFPLPPLEEQKRIVAKMDQLMALCDRLEEQQKHRMEIRGKAAASALNSLVNSENSDVFDANWQRVGSNFDRLIDSIETLKALRATILDLAVRGKLVPQASNDLSNRETANSEESFSLPHGWKWTDIGSLNPDFQNGVSSRGDNDGIPTIVLRLADIQNGSISLNNTRTIPIAEASKTKYALAKGDVLIIRVNGSAAIVGSFVLCREVTEAIYCDHFIRMRVPQQFLFPDFTALLGASSVVRDAIRDLFITTAGQKTVNQGHIKSLMIPLPPLEEQKRIVAKADQLMALCDRLEANLSSRDALGEKLAASFTHHLLAA